MQVCEAGQLEVVRNNKSKLASRPALNPGPAARWESFQTSSMHSLQDSWVIEPLAACCMGRFVLRTAGNGGAEAGIGRIPWHWQGLSWRFGHFGDLLWLRIILRLRLSHCSISASAWPLDMLNLKSHVIKGCLLRGGRGVQGVGHRLAEAASPGRAAAGPKNSNTCALQPATRHLAWRPVISPSHALPLLKHEHCGPPPFQEVAIVLAGGGWGGGGSRQRPQAYAGSVPVLC